MDTKDKLSSRSSVPQSCRDMVQLVKGMSNSQLVIEIKSGTQVVGKLRSCLKFMMHSQQS